jgi:hypothetical protein
VSIPQTPTLILGDSVVRNALSQAWRDSQPGVSGGHEEGGFIIRNVTGELSVARWPKGDGNTIILPPHHDCKTGEGEIVASFHTHPNTGSDFLQEPSETDKRAVRDDPDLKGDNYVGEFVISRDTIYLISPNGDTSELTDTETYFEEE